MGLTFANRRWSLLPLQVDLYGGAPGVILTLAYLGQITGQSRYEETARTAFKTLRARLAEDAPYVTTIGAFHGWGALIYTFTHLGALWQDATLWEAAAGFVERLRFHCMEKLLKNEWTTERAQTFGGISENEARRQVTYARMHGLLA